MLTRFSKLVGLALITAPAAGCVSPPPAQIVSRNVHAVEAGGPGEVWVVMGETGTQLDKDGAYVNHDGYAIYHCIPQGCRRVSELRGTEAFVKRGAP